MNFQKTLSIHLFVAIALCSFSLPPKANTFGQDPFKKQTTLEVNKEFTFKIAKKGDKILRRINIPQNGYIRFSFQDPKVKYLVPQAKYMDADNKMIGSWEARVQKGVLNVQISDDYNDRFSDSAIKGKFEFYPEMDAENDSFESPRPLKMNTEIEFAMMPLKDVDYYSFEAKETGYLRLTMAPTGIKYLNPKPQIYDADQKKIGTNEARVVKGKSYFVSIADDYSDRSAPKLLKASVEFFKEMDSESDSFKSPRKIISGNKFDYAIMPRGDIDYFEFNADKAGYARFKLGKSGVKYLDPIVEIFDASQNKIGDAEARLEKGNTYVARIQDKWTDRSAPKLLTASFDFYEEKDKHEPNNQIEQSIPSKLDSVYQFSIMPVKDVDFFKVEIPGAGMVWAEISKSTVKNLTPHVWIYDEDKQLLSKNHYAQVAGPTTVYFSVYDQWSDASSPETFDLSFRFVEEIDLNEPNNKPFMSTNTSLNRDIQGAILPAGDIDFYEFEIAEPGYLLIDSIEIPKGLNLSFQVCDSSGKSLSGWGFHFKVDNGKFLLKAAAANGQSSRDLYTFHMKWSPEFDELERKDKEAANVKLEQRYSTANFPKGDVDYWSLELDETSRIGISKRGLPVGIKHLVQVFDMENKQVFHGELPCTLVKGKYTLKTWTSAPTPAGFDFTLIKLSTKDKFEFNDTFESAKEIQLGKDYDIYLDLAYDKDFFKFHVTQEELISVDCYYQSLNRMNKIYVHVYDSEQNLIEPDKSAITRWSKVLPAGEYFVRFSSPTPQDTCIRMSVCGQKKSESHGGLAVAVVGLKLNDKEKALTNMLAESTGSIFIDTNEDTTINEAVETAVKEVVVLEEAKPVLQDTELDVSNTEIPGDPKQEFESNEFSDLKPTPTSYHAIWIVITPLALLFLIGYSLRRKQHDNETIT